MEDQTNLANNNPTPQGTEQGTQPYRTFNSQEDYERAISGALKNKEKRIQELEYETKKLKYSKDLSNFDSKIQELLLNKIDFTKNDDEIKKQISSLNEEYKEFINDERQSNISFVNKQAKDQEEESFIDKMLKVDIG